MSGRWSNAASRVRRVARRLTDTRRTRPVPDPPAPATSSTSPTSPTSAPGPPEPTAPSSDPWIRTLLSAAVLPSRRPRQVVVITADATAPEVTRLIADVFADDTVRVLTTPEDGNGTAADLAAVRENLARSRLPDVIVLRWPIPGGNLEPAVVALFHHLRRGGVLILDRRGLPPGPAWSTLSDLLGVVLRAGEPAERDALPPRQRELALSLRKHVDCEEFVALVQGVHHQLKVRDRDAEALLEQRPGAPRWTVLARRPAATFAPRAQVHHHGRTGPPVVPITEFAFPSLTLRRYEDRVAVAGHSLVHADGLILPESIRHHLRETLVHERTVNLDPWLARVRRHHRPDRVLPGSYFHLDSPVPGHFGHLLTEVASRLWAWPEAKQANPDLRALYRRSKLPERAEVDLEILTGFGIAAQDITVIEEPVFVDHLYSATPAWHNAIPHTVHPEIGSVWAGFRRTLVRTPGTDRRIFVSRPPDIKNRPCTDTTEVEVFFEALGFRVVYPERLSFREQAELFAGAEVVAGFAGSGLFNVLFSERLTTLVILSHESYTARNEFLFAGVLGCELHYFWSPPGVAQPPGRWSLEAFHSGWRFGLERHADELRRLLN